MANGEEKAWRSSFSSIHSVGEIGRLSASAASRLSRNTRAGGAAIRTATAEEGAAPIT